jgi:hypothetical protein
MKIDLSDKGYLCANDARLYDSLITEINDAYTEITKKFIKQNNLIKYGLLLSVANRNPSSNKIYECLSELIFIKSKLDNKEIVDTIIVNSHHSAILINKLVKTYDLKNKINIQSKENLKFNKISILKNITSNFTKTVYLFLTAKICGKFFLKETKINKDIIFVDNFLFPESFANNHFTDRYYTGFDKHLDKDFLTKIHFSPTLIGFRSPSHFFKLFKNANNLKYNFLFQEYFLNLKDYFYALYLSFYTPIGPKIYPHIFDINLSEIFKDQLYRDIFSMELNNAIHKFIFIKKLAKKNYKIKKFINWHENQNIDRALVLSCKENFPGIKITGYQGYFPAVTEPHKMPTDFENDLQTLPDEIGLISKHLLLNNHKYTKINYFLAPAFRFSWLHEISISKRKKNIKNILVAMPIYEEEVLSILDTCANYIKITKNIKFTIKFHPSYSKSYILDKFKIYSQFEVSYENISDLLIKSDLMISSSSSACIESILIGVPVAIAGNSNKLSMNSIPENMLKKSWGIFYDLVELTQLIDQFNNLSLQKLQISRIDLACYVEEVGSKNTSYLFDES